jgi:hypothetical protein
VTTPLVASDIQRARCVLVLPVLRHVCDCVKECRDHAPHDARLGSRRIQVNCSRRDIRLILPGEKWLRALVADRSVRSAEIARKGANRAL